MTFFIAVLFVCANGSCDFIQAQMKFESAEKCEAVVKGAVEELIARGAMAQGACLTFNTKDLT